MSIKQVSVFLDAEILARGGPNNVQPIFSVFLHGSPETNQIIYAKNKQEH
jgi:hypothetical protein